MATEVLVSNKLIQKAFEFKKDLCSICTKAVFLVDKIAADDKIFHKTCLRCGHCKKVLSLGNYAALNGKPHFKQLFALKGNYSDGFSASQASFNSQDATEIPVKRASVSSRPATLPLQRDESVVSVGNGVVKQDDLFDLTKSELIAMIKAKDEIILDLTKKIDQEN